MSASFRRRALGQHFLRDAAVARAIVEALGPGPRDLVVEIGPGEGALTEDLARRAGRLVAIEIDPALARRLRARLPGLDVREADARTWDYAGLVRPQGGRVLVAGNLPYSAGTRILAALVDARQSLDAIVVMLQREVAERVAAPPGGRDYGSLSVLTQVACEVELLLRVPPGAFRPPPQVESAVLRLIPRAAPPVPIADEARFRTVVRAAFARRRKALANALAAGLGASVSGTRAACARAGIDPSRRAETLSIAEFARLAEILGPAAGGT